jgi:Methyltransferase domain
MITVEELLADPPRLHVPLSLTGATNGSGPVELVNQWKLSDEELLFINKFVGKNSRTLETGAGCSTILFAMLGSRHTCIVPDQPLVDRILAFCKDKQIPTSNLNFIVDISERVLPQIKDKDFDLALIDGRHGFPQPFIDWYYAADLLKIGGYVVIDDLHIWVCEMLMNFLLAEEDWNLVHESLGGCVFQKLGNSAHNKEYVFQRFITKRSRAYSLSAKGRYLVGLLRRRNFSLFGSTLKLAAQSALAGKFGQRPKGRR